MSNTGSYLDAPEYDVPSIVRSMGNLLRGPRGRYSTNFTDVFSSDREVQYEYVNGLLAVMISFTVVLIFWVFVLFVLKFRGDVGCASGQPFQTKEDDEDLISTDDDMGDSFGSLGSASRTDSQAGDDNSVSKLIKNKDNLQNLSADGSDGEGGPPTDNTTRNGESFENHSQTVKKQAPKNQRERRTRFCFLVCSLVSFICVPLILVLSFGPLKEAAQTSDELAVSARDTLMQVNVSVGSIEDAISSASELVQSVQLDAKVLCPNIDPNEFEALIGIDLNELVSSITSEYDSMTSTSEENIKFVRDLLHRLEEGLVSFENSVTETEEWLWMIPAILFTVSVLTALATLGVLLAWRGKSGKKVQNTMSYFVLPLMMAATIACWSIVIFSSLGTMVGSDVCTASTSEGSPDETIQQILDVLNLDSNSTAFKAATAYTNRCIGPSPIEDLEGLQQIVQENIDTIWRQVSRIDSLGRAQIMETCGATDLEGLLLTARNLAKILTSIRRSLDSASTSLSCPRIYPIYAAAAHDVVCTEAASAAASGFFMFLVLGLCLMTMMSLRASWYQNIKAEKVYHDESEVAENMILDEHEEYLAYISKYKHEWQEYEGFDEKAIDERSGMDEEGSFSDRSDGSSYFDEDYNEDYRSDAEGYNGSMEGSDDGSEGIHDDYQVTIVPTGSTNDSRQPVETASYDDLSLPNFEAQESIASTAMVEEDLLRVPPPPPGNPSYHRQDPLASATAPPVEESSTSGMQKQASASSNAGQPRQSTSFFDKYGIDPGCSVRNVTPTRASTDPPAGDMSTSDSSIQARTLPRPRNSSRSQGSRLSSRTFFKTTAMNDDGVEIQLGDSPYSPRPDMTVYEC